MAGSNGPEPGDGQKARVTRMFNAIAGRYDFLNHLLSFNLDRVWRKKAIGMLKANRPASVLDVAAGTGDFTRAALTLKPARIVGVDISEAMLDQARRKCSNINCSTAVEFMTGDAEHLPFGNQSFDAVICAFGVRNFEHTGQGIAEMFRILKKDGSAVILEFSRPSPGLFGTVYRFYFNVLLPRIGRLVSGNASAYSYLPESVTHFPEGEAFLELMRQQGFSRCSLKRLTFGIATVYTGIRGLNEPGEPLQPASRHPGFQKELNTIKTV